MQKTSSENCQETAHARSSLLLQGSVVTLDKQPSKKFIIVRAVFLLVFFLAISIFPANLFASKF